MNGQKNFDDVPAGGSISYQQLLMYLEQGREIEFTYMDKEFFISKSPEGRAIWSGQTMVSENFSEDHISLLELTKIDGTSLADLFKQNKIEISTVF
ncbi:hypothetical protein ABE29_03955 [Cytobacillus firmus]|uniref:hypothetical protein n=1 Tax=Cytobacillus firmus TaxID=1399 RepID=UPI00077C0EF9|nr:hypothetical protein [Cytobacillus firmus]MBG9541997.1 hypothetical protein [Cytobacillus firmus]MBG9551689.1 hypothetical protein [Cytobacillus firmus]MBG9556264.1 hypothetical protein [Cytobacillus firmus]MBG9576105.1 hypothetical protein [Cytobacillus firmus]MBG9654176.1 hypothetical protein [Cytobacillus firmus]